MRSSQFLVVTLLVLCTSFKCNICNPLYEDLETTLLGTENDDTTMPTEDPIVSNTESTTTEWTPPAAQQSKKEKRELNLVGKPQLLSLIRRESETATSRRKQQCDRCRENFLCKNHNLCTACKVICDANVPKENSTSTGDGQPEVVASRFGGGDSNNISQSPLYYTIGSVNPGPTFTLLARVLGIPSQKARDTIEQMIIVAKAKGENNGNADSIEDKAKMFSKDGNKSPQILPNTERTEEKRDDQIIGDEQEREAVTKCSKLEDEILKPHHHKEMARPRPPPPPPHGYSGEEEYEQDYGGGIRNRNPPILQGRAAEEPQDTKNPPPKSENLTKKRDSSEDGVVSSPNSENSSPDDSLSRTASIANPIMESVRRGLQNPQNPIMDSLQRGLLNPGGLKNPNLPQNPVGSNEPMRPLQKDVLDIVKNSLKAADLVGEENPADIEGPKTAPVSSPDTKPENPFIRNKQSNPVQQNPSGIGESKPGDSSVQPGSTPGGDPAADGTSAGENPESAPKPKHPTRVGEANPLESSVMEILEDSLKTAHPSSSGPLTLEEETPEGPIQSPLEDNIREAVEDRIKPAQGQGPSTLREIALPPMNLRQEEEEEDPNLQVPNTENRNIGPEEIEDPANFKNLGALVPVYPNDKSDNKRVYFVGKDIKLPLQMFKDENGVLQLKVDMDKMCHCKNKNCTRAHPHEDEEEDIQIKTHQKREDFVTAPMNYKYEYNMPKEEALRGMFKRSPAIEEGEIGLEKYDELSKIGEYKFEDVDDDLDLEQRLEELNKNVMKYENENKKLLNRGTVALFHNAERKRNVKKIVDLAGDMLAMWKELAASHLE